MKTIKEIDKEITEITAHYGVKDKEEKFKERELNKARARLKWLRQCKTYLETAPTEEFAKTQLAKVDARVEQ